MPATLLPPPLVPPPQPSIRHLPARSLQLPTPFVLGLLLGSFVGALVSTLIFLL